MIPLPPVVARDAAHLDPRFFDRIAEYYVDVAKMISRTGKYRTSCRIPMGAVDPSDTAAERTVYFQVPSGSYGKVSVERVILTAKSATAQTVSVTLSGPSDAVASVDLLANTEATSAVFEPVDVSSSEVSVSVSAVTAALDYCDVILELSQDIYDGLADPVSAVLSAAYRPLDGDPLRGDGHTPSFQDMIDAFEGVVGITQRKALHMRFIGYREPGSSISAEVGTTYLPAAGSRFIGLSHGLVGALSQTVTLEINDDSASLISSSANAAIATTVAIRDHVDAPAGHTQSDDPGDTADDYSATFSTSGAGAISRAYAFLFWEQ